MIRLKIILRVDDGVEHEVFAACGAIVRGQLVHPIERACAEVARQYDVVAPLNIVIDVGALRYAMWQVEFPARVLSALHARRFAVFTGSAPFDSGWRRRNVFDAERRRLPDSPSSGVTDRSRHGRTLSWEDRAPAEQGLGTRGDPQPSSANDSDADSLCGRLPTRADGRSLQPASDHEWMRAFVDAQETTGGAPWSKHAPRRWFDAQWRNNPADLTDFLDIVQQDMGRVKRFCNLLGQVDAERLMRLAARRADASTRGVSRKRNGDAEILPLTNAGLICLWPLVPGLLKAIDLCPALPEKGVAPTDAAVALSERAAVALDYLVWGDDVRDAARMSLNRWLCGLTADVAIEVAPLEPWHREKVEAWLRSLPPRIPGLHGCSATDLRQLFLQRAGRIAVREGRRKLEVESDASDILLNALPWPLQQAVFPWLSEPIPVVWGSG